MATFFRLSGYVKLAAAWTDQESLGDVVETALIAPPATLDNGTAAGQANCLWQEAVPVPAGGTVTIDTHALPTTVYGGGGSVNMQSAKLLYVVNAGTVPLLVRVPGLVQSTDTAAATRLPPGAWLLAMAPADGWSSSDHQIVVTNQAGAAGALVIALAGIE